MSTFAFPDDESSEFIPSTPDRRSTRSHPSTTPAGPPPSGRGLPSFTPKGPPPSSAFGSSRMNTGDAKAGKSNSLFSAQPRTGAPSVSFGATFSRQAPASSPPQAFVIDDEPEEEEDDEMEDDVVNDSLANISPGFNPFKISVPADPFGMSRGNNSMKQSKFGDSLRQSTRSMNAIEGMDIHGIARGIAAASPRAELNDPDTLILETERISEQFGAKRSRSETTSLADISSQLIDVWRTCGAMKQDEIEGDNIGPLDENAKIAKANFLSSLMILLHHPPTAAPQPSRSSRFGESDDGPLPIPKVLLDWLDTYHDPSADAVAGVLEYEDGYSASSAFWDAIYLSLTRGRFDTTLQLLRGANFKVAVAGEDGDNAGYNASQLRNIDQVIAQAIRLLESCPAVSGDWDIKGSDWSIFRRRVEQTKSSLRDFAEGESRHEIDELQSSRFGRSSHNAQFSLSQASRRAESKVPFEVYESLMDVYNQLLGTPADLLKSSFDWVEAVLAVTIWWDGEDNEIPKGSLAASRRSQSRVQQSRQVDVTPTLAYRQKLLSSFALTMSEEDLKDTFDSTDPVHVGLACIFESDVEGLLGILKTWSMPISAAFAELAEAGGWLSNDSNAHETVEKFDDNDLMVLSYGAPGGSIVNKKDEILAEYAELLSAKPAIEISSTETIIEGWQLALRVLGRLDDFQNADTKVAALLNELRFSSNEQVDHVLDLCNDLGFSNHAMSITEVRNLLVFILRVLNLFQKYADTVAESTHRYGDALLYYTRAHKFDKAKRVVDVLISTSLVTSTAYPPWNEVDDRLKTFVTSPEDTLTDLAAVDFDAADKIAAWLSGYATLRRFYDLRDEEVTSKSGQKPGRSLVMRKRAAAEALLAVISSAGDSIRGGLYDSSVQVVVPVDGLLVLLGEALPLLDGSVRIFNLPQLFELLRAVEDLQTIGQRIYAKCEEVFQSALENVQGGDLPSPRALLRKETSSMTASSQFSMVGSSLLNSKELGTVGSSEGSGVLIKSGEVKRGWDWRQGLRRNLTGADILKVVRLSLSEEVAKAWAHGEDRS
jgi:hypothetical protein